MLLLLKQTVSHGASARQQPPISQLYTGRQNFGLVCFAAYTSTSEPCFSQGYPSKGYRKTMHGLFPFFLHSQGVGGVWHVC